MYVLVGVDGYGWRLVCVYSTRWNIYSRLILHRLDLRITFSLSDLSDSRDDFRSVSRELLKD